jgi:D-3-phosphoglycerate dehydrogenase
MKILIADKISSKAIEKLESAKYDVVYEPEITPTDLLTRVADVQALIIRSRTKVTKEVIEAGKELKIVGRVGTGLDNVDKAAASEKKIQVVNAPDANSTAVAELTIGMMIALLRKLDLAYTSMKKGEWRKKDLMGSELSAKTVGIVGHGNIGKKVESLLKAFGCRVLIYSRSYQTVDNLEKLFFESDIITLHLSLSDETRGMIEASLLYKMKPTAYLVNLARAQIVDQQALYTILKDHKIAGAALDVFETEPLEENSPLRALDNVILSPHIGASTHESVERASLAVIEQVLQFLGMKMIL